MVIGLRKVLANGIEQIKKGGKMANIRISELNEKTEVGINDIVPIVDTTTNETKKITGANLLKNQYSLNEVKTNMIWLDGKPIYRKVVNVSNLIPTDTFVKIPHGINNLDKVISLKCIASNGSDYFDFNNYTWYESQNWSTLHTFISQNNIFVDYMGAYYINFITDAYFILEYTKTTDIVE
jgi:hypothetical protein